MKVATIAFHRANNYGAILQVYALQQIILGFGHDCEVLDYRCEGVEKQYRYKKLVEFKHPKSTALFNINQFLHKKRHKEFAKFRMNIKFSNLYTSNTISLANKLYDCYIAGSDQIWNYKCSDFDYSYFLDFVDENYKKNSYAASFGMSYLPDTVKEDYRKYLAQFQNISLREEGGNSIIKELLDINCSVVLDPVLLLERREWMKISNTIKSDYILFYQIYDSKELQKFVVDLAKKKGLKIFSITQTIEGEIFGFLHGTRKSNVGPEEFVTLFRNAKYIVTNSFHGTAFSIIFNKLFFTEYIANGVDDVNSRFDSIFNLLDLHKRKIINSLCEDIDEEIDYVKINNVLEKERKNSMEFLESLFERKLDE